MLKLAQSELSAEVQATGESYEYQTFSLGDLTVERPGRVKVVLHPARTLDHDLLYLQSVELTSVD